MKSSALKQFRKKMANPLHWRMVNKTLSQSSKSELQNLEGASRLIGKLAQSLNIDLSASDQRQAAEWLMKKEIDPKSPRDRLGLWKSVKSKSK